MAKVLILDQSKSMRNTLRERLEYEGFSTEAAEDEEAASNMCEKIPFDVILSDTGCKIPDKGVPFIVLSSEASIDSAVEAVRNGAQDYLTKPIDMNRLLQSIHRTIDDPAPVPAPAAAPARRTRRGHNAQTEHIIGTSPQIEHVRLLIDKVAPCEARVLITGENGTGKELVARWLHAKSNRAAAPFVEVNCAAIPSELIESELFGHERGAFTSAIKQRRGKFEQADGGTLFMDEHCSIDPDAPTANWLIYGHNMADGSMFGQLTRYRSEDFYKAHTTFTFNTIYETAAWQVVAALDTTLGADELPYYTFFDADTKLEWQQRVDAITALSLYDTGVTPAYGQQLLVLSTCGTSSPAAKTRFALLAVRCGEN